MNTPVTVSRYAGPATLKTPLVADDAYSFRTHDESRLEIRDADGWLIVTVHGSGQGHTAKAERLRSEIVRACNSHAQLVAALTDLLPRYEAMIRDTDNGNGQPMKSEAAAIAKARAALNAAQ